MSNKKDISKEALALHKKLGGKISVVPAKAVKNRDDLSLIYTPGVGAVSSFLAKNKKETGKYTMKGKTVAVVSDGSAVLGLGNIGLEGALPVMEGKAVLFKSLAGVDAFPMVLDTQDAKEIVNTVLRIAPNFGGINLEDIAAPKCFDVERELKQKLDIPVIHDDQHGTAIVVLAGLINACKVAGKSLKKISVVVSGAGAAGTAISNLLLLYGVKDVRVLDSVGLLSASRKDLSAYKLDLARRTNPKNISGGMDEAMQNADVFVGVSKPGVLLPKYIKLMNEKPIIFALANPVPEIMPDAALAAGAFVIATGRSDFPNQINNALVFPGLFKGALKNKVQGISEKIKVKAAENLAKMVKNPKKDKIIPGIFEAGVADAVAKSVKQ